MGGKGKTQPGALNTVHRVICCRFVHPSGTVQHCPAYTCHNPRARLQCPVSAEALTLVDARPPEGVIIHNTVHVVHHRAMRLDILV